MIGPDFLSLEHFKTALLPVKHLPILQIIIPLFGALLCALFRRASLAFMMTIAISIMMALISITMLAHVLQHGPLVYEIGGWQRTIGIEYRVDLLNAFVLVLISVIGVVITPYALKSIGNEIEPSRHAWFYTMYLLCMTGLLGITITNDAFNVFVFLEISSLATYTMIAMGKDRRALIAAYQYLIIGTIGATFYIIGVGLIFTVTGTLNMTDLVGKLAEAYNAGGFQKPVLAGLAFITVGVCLKLALFPLHVWLPNAYAYAPSFATVFLAATATKVAIYVLIRFFFSIFGKVLPLQPLPLYEILLVLSVAAMFLASIVAIFQTNIKRMLAYSSVAQIGYITLGISLVNQAGLSGGIVHLFNHALMKASLFMCIGAVVYRFGTVKLENLAGLGRLMPITMGAFVIAGLSLIGVPGTVGFISKWYLVAGAVDKHMWWLAFLIVASSLISVVYIGRVVEIFWFRMPHPDLVQKDNMLLRLPITMTIPIIIVTLATVYFGIDTANTVGVAQKAANLLLGGLK